MCQHNEESIDHSLWLSSDNFIGGSEAAPVQNGQAWRSVNYAIATLLEFHMDLYDAIADSQCPGDLTGTFVA